MHNCPHPDGHCQPGRWGARKDPPGRQRNPIGAIRGLAIPTGAGTVFGAVHRSLHSRSAWCSRATTRPSLGHATCHLVTMRDARVVYHNHNHNHHMTMQQAGMVYSPRSTAPPSRSLSHDVNTRRTTHIPSEVWCVICARRPAVAASPAWSECRTSQTPGCEMSPARSPTGV